MNREKVKTQVRELVVSYFNTWRQRLASQLRDVAVLEELDAGMRTLRACTGKRSSTNTYKQALKRCQEALDKVEDAALESVARASAAPLGELEQQVLRILSKDDPAAALCYEQGLMDLADMRRKSWRGTILEFREALRETLHRLAPDEEVIKLPRPEPEPGARGRKITMAERVRHICRSRGFSEKQRDNLEKATEDVEAMLAKTLGEVVRAVYDRASAGVHAQRSKEEAERVRRWVTSVLAELLSVAELRVGLPREDPDRVERAAL